MEENNPCDIITLAGKFKSYSELQGYSDKQYIALQKAAEKIQQLESEVDHLKTLLMNTTALIPKTEFEISDEEVICDLQIARLKERSLQQELTLEETKKLDLLIKNKRLAKEQSTTIVADSKNKIDTSEYTKSQLIQLAAQPIKNES